MWAPLWSSDLSHLYDWEELYTNIQEHEDGKVKGKAYVVSVCNQDVFLIDMEM